MNRYCSASSLKAQIILRFLIVIILLGPVSGCLKNVQTVNHLREAQTSFNEAAALENESRMGSLNPFTTRDMRAEVGNTIAIQNGYASALISINNIYPSDKDQLKNDKILGHTLFLKSMAQWRIGDFDNALTTANEALKEAGDQLYPRDAAVLAALPGLIKIDLSFREIEKMRGRPATENKITLGNKIYPRLVDNTGGAVNDIRAARNKVNRKHEINLYLIQAQLSAYRNYQVAYQLSNEDLNDPADDSPATITAKKNLDDLDQLINVLKLKPESGTLVDYWQELLGF